MPGGPASPRTRSTGGLPTCVESIDLICRELERKQRQDSAVDVRRVAVDVTDRSTHDLTRPETVPERPLRGSKRDMESNSDWVPAWAKQAIWYQIFPERFRNGNQR